MRTFILWICSCFSLALTGQHVCEADRVFEDSAVVERYQDFILAVQKAERDPVITSRSLRYIPVVIHVVAGPGVQPVSMAQALHQIDVLNQDFSGNGENLYKLPPAFQDLVGASDFRFCLANIDPDGNPTTGITYTPTDNNTIAFDYFETRRRLHYDLLGGKSGWPDSIYVNVWVVDYRSVLGSATLPGVAPFPEENGLVINATVFGSFGDAGAHSQYDGGHTLTHEMGHYFGLLHIWGQGFNESCEDSDGIDDTPNAAGPTFGCPEGEVHSCGTSNLYQNFMDLADDYCLSMFTRDQVARMEAIRNMFYPNLGSEEPCGIPLADNAKWYGELTWSADIESDKLIVYHPDGFNSDVVLQVYSTDGREVISQLWRAGDVTAMIDLSRAGSGVFIICITVDGEMRSRKIVHY
jgi:hypothetical protein